MTGTIKRIVTDRGFGFIRPEGTQGKDSDIFFHMSELSGRKFEDVHEGDHVEFETESTNKGQRAINVKVL